MSKSIKTAAVRQHVRKKMANPSKSASVTGNLAGDIADELDRVAGISGESAIRQAVRVTFAALVAAGSNEFDTLAALAVLVGAVDKAMTQVERDRIAADDPYILAPVSGLSLMLMPGQAVRDVLGGAKRLAELASSLCVAAESDPGDPGVPAAAAVLADMSACFVGIATRAVIEGRSDV